MLVCGFLSLNLISAVENGMLLLVLIFLAAIEVATVYEPGPTLGGILVLSV